MTAGRPEEIVVSGLRPTGILHLGNYHGAIKNWAHLQGLYRCYFFVADWHALTSDYADTSGLKARVFETVADWLALGLDPEKCTIFAQSRVKAHAELHLLFSMVTPMGWLLRVPTYKEQLREIKGKDLATYGFLGYPVLQAADVAVYRGTQVPVGEDQVAHLELAREIVRRFNQFYGNVLPEPKPLLTPIAKVPGTDGRKMSKSYGNTITFADSEDDVRRKIMAAVTDPQRKRRQDPGRPEVCGIYTLHKLYSSAEDVAAVDRECRVAGIGCVDCKKVLLKTMEPSIGKVRSRRAEIMADADFIGGVLETGARRAAEAAERNMEEVRRAVGISASGGGIHG